MPIILLIIGIALIVFNYISIKKEGNSFEIKDMQELRKENSFGHVLEKSKDELDDYKIELGIFRRNVAESLTELQEEILEIKKYLNIVKNEENLYDDNIEEENTIMENSSVDDDIVSEINFNNVHNHKIFETKNNDENYDKNTSDSKKTEIIKELLEQGLSVDEVCHKLSISKGEVLLVKDLFRK
ncbi:hypothetical protein [uncultured Clostridium sp.]|uniref:hypothetical protein n=1 Tax=uncultured Clostridium sp. TaxID=59620 RepID=UPI0025D08670|nr:hypothetical protein [uncultured Clostridium sp.]